VYFPDKGHRRQSHIPFRDKASQMNLRPHRRFANVAEKASPQTQREPEEEPGLDEVPDLPLEPHADDEREAERVLLPLEGADTVPDLPESQAIPSMEEYKRRWTEKLQHHADECKGAFSTSNLVPQPVPQLWNDCRLLSSCGEQRFSPGLCSLSGSGKT